MTVFSNKNTKLNLSGCMKIISMLHACMQDQCISFDKQIDYFASVHASLVQSLGQAQATAHLAKSLFAITIGSNDIIHYAKANSATSATADPSQQFVDALIQTLTGQLQRASTAWARARCCSWARGPWGAPRRCGSSAPPRTAAPWPTASPCATTPPRRRS